MPSHNILIINTASDISALYEIFKSLKKDGLNFYFFNSDKKFVEKTKKENWEIKILPLLKTKHGKLLFSIFILLFPLGFLLLGLGLFYFKKRKKISTVFFFSLSEAVLLGLVSKALGLNPGWLFLPGQSKLKDSRFLTFASRILASPAKIITFLSQNEKELAQAGFKETKIINLTPGINLQQFHQKNIFSQIAEVKKESRVRKYFTIGTSISLTKEQNLEIIFRAIKKSLTVVPNLQLIIVGDGEERKNLRWLAKKLEINNLVWFVGEQTYLKKWLNNLDLYMVSASNLKLNNINDTLEAMAASLPIIGPARIGLEDFIKNDYSGQLLDSFDSDLLSQTIIDLKKNIGKRNTWGGNAQKKVLTDFTIKKEAQKIKKLILDK